MLSSLVLSTTYKCPIKCRYCGAECSPENNERLSYEELVNFINGVFALKKLRLVVFTGGEPFLLGKDLLDCVRYCANKGLNTRIVTNAYWAKTPQIARKILNKYVDAGLTEINLSCDDYHQEYIPLKRIKYANDICNELKLPCLIGHKVMKDCKITIEYIEKHLDCKLTLFDKNKKNPSNNIISSGYTVPISDNMHMIADADILYPETNQHWTGPCSTILKHVIITPRKELAICCGMIPRKVQEIFYGPIENIDDLKGAIVSAHQDLIVNWLALEGPYSIMKFILKKEPNTPFRNNYVNICHLCSEILTREDCRLVLSKYGHEKCLEISLERALYDSIRNSPQFFIDHLVPG